MPQNPREVLGETNYQQIVEGIESAESAIALAELSRQAGLDVGDAMRRATETRDRLLKIKNTFFPGR